MGIRGNWEKRRVGPLGALGEIDRRTFVKMSSMGAAALVFGVGPFAASSSLRPRFSDYPFSLGVASGDPAPDGVVLWTRLAPDPLNGGGMPESEVPVQWQVADDENFRRVVRQGVELARPDLAHSVHVEVDGLEPAREYFYRFVAGFETSPVGRTRTAPNGRSSGMVFAFASCQQYEHGYYTAYSRMSEEDLDLVVHLGDYIYEYGAHEDLSAGGNVRAHQGSETFTLQGYRDRHALYRTDADLQAAHAAFPWVVTWDDHEAENNYADEVSEDGVDPVRFLERRTAAYRAYYEHMPLRRSSIPWGPDMPLYRRLAYGDLVEFNVLDTSQYRDDQANGDGTKPPSPESLNPNRTLLGAEQEHWLLDGLAASGARWNVLAQQTFFAQRDYSHIGQALSMDSWDGYVGSRDRIVGSMIQSGVENPVVLTGNVHANWANEILTNFDDPASRPVGVEFVGTSISTGGDGSDALDPGYAALLSENPHLKFYNDRRGYVRCRVTPDAWQTDYRVLPYVTEPGAPISTKASFAVEAGNPRIQEG